MCMARVCPANTGRARSSATRLSCQNGAMAKVALHLSGDKDADALISRNSLALLIGMVLDQQITIEKAFSSPAVLQRRMGSNLSAQTIANMDPAKLAELFREFPALHRFPGSMAARVQAV